MHRGATHRLQFYDQEHTLFARVGEFLREGLAEGDALLVVATPSHTEEFLSRLRAAGITPNELIAARRLVIADARQTLQQFFIEGWPDPARFQATLGAAIGDLRRANPGARVRAFGEMVDLLVRDGLVEAALALEALWDAFIVEHRVDLLCGYHRETLFATASEAQLAAVYARHGDPSAPR